MKSLLLILSQLGIMGIASAADCFYESKKFTENDFFAETRFYPLKDSHRSVIILPPTGGTNIIDRSYARFLCGEGFNVYILNKWTMFDEYALDLDIHRRFYARVQRAVDLIIKNIPLDHEVGILGTSVGALHASIATGRNPRITKGLFITGGADIASIIVDSDQKAMQIAREKRNAMYGFKSRDEYYNELRKHIELDSLFFRDNYPGKKVFMVIGEADTTVPVKNQLLLKETTRPSRVLSLPNNHYWAIVKTWLFHRDFVLNSFQ